MLHFDRFPFPERDELGWRLSLEVLKFHFPHWDGSVDDGGELRVGFKKIRTTDALSALPPACERSAAGAATPVNRSSHNPNDLLEVDMYRVRAVAGPQQRLFREGLR
jgi:hypothetical protein